MRFINILNPINYIRPDFIPSYAKCLFLINAFGNLVLLEKAISRNDFRALNCSIYGEESFVFEVSKQLIFREVLCL